MERESIKKVLKPIVKLNKYRREHVQKYERTKCVAIWIIGIIACLAFWFLVAFSAVKAFADDSCEVDQTKVVVHHTDSGDVSAKTIDKWHKERGWDGIGYHYVVRKDGTIEKGRPNCKHGAHAKGRNNYIGIVLTGRDSFSQAQLDSLEKFLRDRKIRYVENHHGQCPGHGINLQRICKKLGITFAYHN